MENPEVFIALAGIAGFVVGGLLAWLFVQGRFSQTNERMRFAEVQLEELKGIREENERLKLELNSISKDLESSQEKVQWLESAEQKLREAFQSLAAQTLQTNSEEFIKRAKAQLDAITERLKGDWGVQKQEMHRMVEPLQESLKKMDQQVQSLEQKREGAYSSLREQLNQLFTTHQQLQQTTTTLTQALKSSSIRGRWGEIQLRRIVEMAGLLEHVDFDEQQSTSDGRPDMVIHLPNGGILAVDAKTPMESYLSAMECADDQRKIKLIEHANALKSRVRELGAKRYWQSFERTPEFVIMFIPNDSCLTAAFEQDGTLLEYAMEQRVMPSTPLSLLALLKAVAFGWQQHQIAENARHVSEVGRELYERMSVFTGHLGDLGNRINSTVQTYNKAVGSLDSRVMPQARRLREMGIGTKELDSPGQVDAMTRLPTPQEVELPEENGHIQTD